MMTLDDRHLTDAELFGLAAPAAGEPEALPRHLSECQACSRALQDWKSAVRSLADHDLGELSQRTGDEWRAAEDATLAAIRRAGRPGRRTRSVRWVMGIAASLLLVALAMPWRRAEIPSGPGEIDETSALSAQDREDDELLRDVADLAAGADLSRDLLGGESL